MTSLSPNSNPLAKRKLEDLEPRDDDGVPVGEIDGSGVDAAEVAAEANDGDEKSIAVDTNFDRKPVPLQLASLKSQSSFPMHGTGSSKQIQIPTGMVDVIIGKGGETIKYLQLQSGAKIEVSRDTVADPDSDTMVELIGTSEQISKAEQLINDLLSEKAGLLQVQSGAEPSQIKIPNNRVGLIAGKGGDIAKSVQAKSGARIQINQSGRLKDLEISFAIVYGTVSFWLGKKATEYNSHKWTVYVRGAGNEDLSVIIKRVVFQLHPSFNNPTRVVESAPFELSESGWGEFEIAISLYFHDDVCDKQVDLYHQLKLYPEEEGGPQSTKKPVVMESYDEIVFSEPTEAFFLRVQNHPAATVPRLPAGLNLPNPGPIEHLNEKKRGDTKDHSLSQWFTSFSEADELLKLAAARQQVQAHIGKLRRQLNMIDGPQHPKVSSGQ